MWRLLKFLLLVILCIPAWIGLQVAWEAYAPSPVPSSGARAAVDSKLKGEHWRVVAMDPQAQSDSWRLTGLLEVPGEGSAMSERVFLADLRSSCEGYADPKCWAVEHLAYADADDFGAADSLPKVSGNKNDRVKAVQSGLKTLGFDPGPVDGSLGKKTRAAIKQYLEKNTLVEASLDTGLDAGAVMAPTPDRVMNELEALGRLNLAQDDLVDGDYRGALVEYGKVRSLDPDLPQAYYNSGAIYRGMGLPELAIDEYDLALSHKPDWEQAFYQRGSAYYQQKRYVNAYSDYASGLGVRFLGERYFGLREQVVALGQDAFAGAVKLSHWAEETWQKTAGTWLDRINQDKAEQAADDPATTSMAVQPDANA